jgi:hypothetical protein
VAIFHSHHGAVIVRMLTSARLYKNKVIYDDFPDAIV